MEQVTETMNSLLETYQKQLAKLTSIRQLLPTLLTFQSEEQRWQDLEMQLGTIESKILQESCIYHPNDNALEEDDDQSDYVLERLDRQMDKMLLVL